ncbi:response regulator transcription factor [Streptomyces sp. NBC_01260]|uniref:response regulator transcription factor n=1 Tax=unclassified Streptomyces TaxID=2593676 RepID=UPI000F4771E1|nr:MULTISPECIES: response regulator transcription factor [unclassified Streptomyces]MCX4768264.1 response regulator transcription factor [Streptomyces sp. NBC_01285]ROQ77608.1 winged helix family two component transcriptional regulator [Streptomyces sp. CEV 2-1]RPK39196.1 Response regulator MprA [Streptomyces sp. ADI92-24]
MTAARILVVEDDHGLRDVLARGLRDENFDVVTATDGTSALKAADETVHAVVLDIGLPDSDGRDVCQAMRGAGIAVPVIFLTAHGNLTDRLSGFASGGDDYLVKPFHLSELAARVRAVLHRAGHTQTLSDHAGTVLLDPVRHEFTVRERPVALTPTEFRLLARLLADPGAVVRRGTLVRAAWPEGAQVSDNTLDQYLARLRRKLREADSPSTISTARGVGYRFG